jgi:protein involved in sex pheromone biosynthesis
MKKHLAKAIVASVFALTACSEDAQDAAANEVAIEGASEGASDVVPAEGGSEGATDVVPAEGGTEGHSDAPALNAANSSEVTEGASESH